MGIRKKGRVKFTFGDRLFVWWIDNDTYLRIASDDKRFVVGFFLFDRLNLLAVHGPDFPGLETSARPAWFLLPNLNSTSEIGRTVNDIRELCFNTDGCVAFDGELPPDAGGG